MFSIQQHFSLTDQCLHRGVSIMDNFFAVQTVSQNMPKYAMITAVRLAVKAEMTKGRRLAYNQLEVWKQLMTSLDSALVKVMEEYILMKLKWYIMKPTLNTVLFELAEF